MGFTADVVDSLMTYYGKEQNHTYGTPMDCSTAAVGGPTWLAMQAAAGTGASLDDTHATTTWMLEALYRFANDTDERFPLIDFHDTDTAGPRKEPTQRARPAVGAIYAPLLVNLMKNE